MSAKKNILNQTVITSGCLQMLYLDGGGFEETQFEPIKAYAEYLDIWLVLDGELSIKAFNAQRELKSGEVFLYTRSSYAEFSITSTHFSGVRFRFLKDKVAESSSSMRKRFAASMLGCDIVKQKLKNHCFNFLKLIDFSEETVDKVELNMIQQESQDLLRAVCHMIDSNHDTLDVIVNQVETNELVVSSVDILESNIQTPPQINTIVDELGVSHSYFVRVFKRHIGVAPKVFSNVLRINYALSLISSDMESLSDISYSLGFSDQSHFSNSFREALKFTPGTVPVKII